MPQGWGAGVRSRKTGIWGEGAHCHFKYSSLGPEGVIFELSLQRAENSLTQ